MSREFSSVRLSHGTSLWEYLLVATPDEPALQKLMEEKKIFREQYGHVNTVSDQFYVSIVSFHAKEMMEETLIRWIQNVCRLQQEFAVMLNNYSGRPDGTVYLRIQEPKPLLQLANAVKIIDGFLQSNECPPVCLVDRPYMALESGLPSFIYEKAIVEYAGKTFSGSFKVQKLKLLKREGEYGTVEILNTFTLSPCAE